MDIASLIGIVLGIVAVVGGNSLEGGKTQSILQATAAVIVFGGTLGATLLSFPLKDVLRAAASLKEVFSGNKIAPELYAREIVNYASRARRKGLISLDSEIPHIKNNFFKKALRLAVDGLEPKILRATMEQENLTFEEEKMRAARVFESAGGFAPTVGIIGAVLGLIHVMENLSDPTKLGTGIAVAFVATVYGIGVANLILLPISKKLMNNLKYDLAVREMILEGVLGIQAGLNPHYLEERLSAFLSEEIQQRLKRKR